MNLPEIAVYNFSSKSDAEVQRAVRSINRQVTEDFLPIWGGGYLCSLKNHTFVGNPDEDIANEPVTAEAAMYIVDESHLQGAAGYHFMNGREVPYGFVFTEANNWTITFSHEVLELTMDPNANCFVPGPDPRPGQNGIVLHTYEVCDAVERTSYLIDDVAVSNFVTPQYFVDGNANGTRNDFLGTKLKSFKALPGCHLGFFDLAANEFEIFVQPGNLADTLATKLAAKSSGGRVERTSDDRVPNAARAIQEAIRKTSNKGAREVLEYALRRDAYRLEIESTKKKNK